MSAPSAVFLACLCVSVGAYAIAAACLLRLRQHGRGRPIEGFEPPVSILKPLSGLDEELEESLESFFRLRYGTYEIIFSFASPDDRAYPVARAVADRHPGVASTFVFDGREPGGNRKVNRLEAGLKHARHRLILLSDGNVRVRPDFLRRAVSWFSDSRVGLVSHLFRAADSVSLASRLEARYLNGCLQGGTALVAGILRIPCVVGKSILVSRSALDAIGGFRVLRDFLAEDFLLGREIRRASYRVVLSGDVLDTLEVRKTAAVVWARHRRWAMMRRRLAGPLYAGELLGSPLPWFLAAVATSAPPAQAAAVALLGIRYGIEAALAAGSGEALSALDWALLPLRDIASALVFWAGLTGRSVAWRGRPLRIGRETLILERGRAA
jgi:ceramide glucosyltransferase